MMTDSISEARLGSILAVTHQLQDAIKDGLDDTDLIYGYLTVIQNLLPLKGEEWD